MPTDGNTGEKTVEYKTKTVKIHERTTEGTPQTVEKPTFFFLAKFGSEDISHQERLPKTFADFESLLNKILINLEETEYVFRNQAKEILDRDLVLHTWRTKLKKLQECLEEKRQGHERIDQSMQFVFRLGAQISNTLVAIEKELSGSPQLVNGRRYTPERMSMYDTMLNLNVGQREMLQKFSDAVLSINDLIDCNPCDPPNIAKQNTTSLSETRSRMVKARAKIEQFTRILSLHMETLKTVETKIKQMEEELRTVKSLHEFYTNVKTPTVYEYYY